MLPQDAGPHLPGQLEEHSPPDSQASTLSASGCWAPQVAFILGFGGNRKRQG